MDERNRNVYEQRERAVKLYAEGERVSTIRRKTGVAKKELYIFIDACLDGAADGRIWGFRALTRYVRRRREQQHHTSKLVDEEAKPGSLSALIARYPGIRIGLENLALRGDETRDRGAYKEIRLVDVFDGFLRLCEKHSLAEPHYPYNCVSRGKRSVYRWACRIRLENGTPSVLDGKPAPLAGPNYSIPVSDCYRVAEVDGHKIDYECTIIVPSPRGVGTIEIPITRFFIVVVGEGMVGGPLGHSVCLNAHNYDSEAVTQAIKASLQPWRPRALSLKGLAYRPSDGCPSKHERLSFVCPDEYRFDNAKCQLSERTIGYIESATGAVCVFGSVVPKDSRPYAEGFNALLAEAGIHRITGTTGAHPKDLRRKERGPHLPFDLLEEIIDVLVARVAGSPASGCVETRSELLRQVADDGKTILRRIPPDRRDDLLKYDLIVDVKIVMERGRVFVRYMGARYDSDVLRRAFGLRQKAAVALMTSQDLRMLDLALPDGTSLGRLFVEKRWRATKHSLRTRREILAMDTHLDTSDIVRSYTEYAHEHAVKSKRWASVLARLKKEQRDVVAEENAWREDAAGVTSPMSSDDFNEAAKALEEVGAVY